MNSAIHALLLWGFFIGCNISDIKAKCLFVPIYRRALVVCKSYKEAKQYYKSVDAIFDAPERSKAFVTHLSDNDGLDTFVFVINEKLQEGHKETCATICHEATHLVDMIFESISEETIGFEARAYLCEFLFTEIYEHIFKETA